MIIIHKRYLKNAGTVITVFAAFTSLIYSYGAVIQTLSESSAFYSISKTVVWNGSILIIGILIAIIIYLINNIKRRKEVEEALKESEERLRILIDASPDVICFKDGEGRWLEANKACEDIFGLRNLAFKGKTERELAELNPDYRQAFSICANTDDAAWNAGKLSEVEEVIEVVGREQKILDVIKVPVYDEKGKRKGLVVLGRDVTKRKHTEKKLWEAKERYKRLIQLLPIGILIHDMDGIVFANIPIVEMFGYSSPEQLMGETILKHIHPYSSALVKERMGQIINQRKKVEQIELKGIKTDGTELDIEISSAAFFTEGRVRILSVLRDITERKKTEKLKSKMEEEEKKLKEKLEYDRLKIEFFANLSHELKTPLNLIFSTLQLLELTFNTYVEKHGERLEYMKIKKRMKIIKQNCYRMVRLVNNLIDISKMESGYYALNLRNCNIVSIIEDITISAAEYVNYRHIHLIFDTDTEEKIISCDPDKIERIILNILSNAIKFTDAGGMIEVNIYDQDESVKISVKDSGTGIPPDRITTIFDRFRQADKSFTRNQEGSGIGLTLVKTLVEMHGGRIEVESEVGKGTEFIIVLPANIQISEEEEVIEQKIQPHYVEKINIEFSDIYS